MTECRYVYIYICIYRVLPVAEGKSASFVAVVAFLLSLQGRDFLLSLREPGFTHSLASWVRAKRTKTT